MAETANLNNSKEEIIEPFLQRSLRSDDEPQQYERFFYEETNSDEREEIDPIILLQRQNAIKVVKGEIHNMLSIMRTDARYASPLRFVEEIVVEDHPLLESLLSLSKQLSLHPLEYELESASYLCPFCCAISGRDISVSITGCALSSLHKFLLYGFIERSEGMVLITKSLLHCTFESESISVTGTKGKSLLRPSVEYDEEQVVLKLLSLSALVARCALIDEPLLPANQICGLLDTCLHVSHRAKTASTLLRSAASDSLSQVVLVVFSAEFNKVGPARATILSKLATLLDPQISTDATCVTSLKLMNIALETMQTVTPGEVKVLQDELCKHLLTWSTTTDLIILSLTLRVIFNLFQPMLRNQMKVPLEIFLTSVHIRMLDKTQKQKGFSNEQREAALESLLEFCQEPSLMQDIYLNYDCDVNCTNLFDTILASLATFAAPDGSSVTAHNKLAIEGILAVMDSISRKCQTSRKFESSDILKSPESNNMSDIDESDYNYENENNFDLGIAAQERKRKKHVLQQVANEFNQNNKDWMFIGEEMGLFPSSPTPIMVARFLYTTPQIDKTIMGLYLGKGPENLYPFHAKVRASFCSIFDFKSLSFSDSLRTFLLKFRLPGEAQYIDRLMEAFAAEMYDQQRGNLKECVLFNSSDSVFRMAFSTIMLNTDLHNPGMKEEKRMTLSDFVRNNRGLNDGEDFPQSFISDLYEDIKMNEIQVQKEFMGVAEVMRQHLGDMPSKQWEDILKRNIEAPFFSSAETGHNRIFRPGVQDRDMFVSVIKSALETMSDAFAKSKDDHLVLKILMGFLKMSKICIFFDLDETFNDILQILLVHGRDYIISCVAIDYAGIESYERTTSTGSRSILSEHEEEKGAPSHVLVEQLSLPLPNVLFEKNVDGDIEFRCVSVEGSAVHRGLLTIDCAFKLIQSQSSRIKGAWPTLVECFCALHDARALPDHVFFLDDFADSQGNLLPKSIFAKDSQRRLRDYYRSISNKERKNTSFLSIIFSSGKNPNQKPPLENAQSEGSQAEDGFSPFSRALLEVSKRAKLEELMVLKSLNLPLPKQIISTLLDAIDTYLYFKDPISEQHAVFSLELALLILVSNRDTATELYELFLLKFNSISQKYFFNDEKSASQERTIEIPFLLERIIITILRSCIHLYDLPQVRQQLRTSLRLLMDLPSTFTRFLADRIACGMAIILSERFSLIEGEDEWSFIVNMLDRLALFGPGRGFVFDGIANTVDSQLAPTSQLNDERKMLSFEGSHAMAKLLLKYILGAYQKDMSLCIPAMMCMDNLYRHMILLKRVEASSDLQGDHQIIHIPDQDLWQDIAVGYYSVCQNPSREFSNQGSDCFQRFIASTEIEYLPDEMWLTLLNLVVMKQPAVKMEVARANCSTILGRLLLMTIAHLSKDRGNWEDLTDIITQTALIVGENLREGRQGTVSLIFESTLQSITFLSNHMVSDEFKGNLEYGRWVSDALISELEKVGAGGGSINNIGAI